MDKNNHIIIASTLVIVLLFLVRRKPTPIITKSPTVMKPVNETTPPQAQTININFNRPSKKIETKPSFKESLSKVLPEFNEIGRDAAEFRKDILEKEKFNEKFEETLSKYHMI